MWVEIRERFLQALLEHRVDSWLVSENQHNSDAVVKYRSFADIREWVKYLDGKVAEEETGGAISGVQFYSFVGG